MIDETTGQSWENPNAAAAEPQQASYEQAEYQQTSAGFCQDCGKQLTPETIRTVGTAVFCEPCLQTRLNPGAVPPPPPYGGQPGAAPTGFGTATPPVSNGLPSPAAAGWLGILPGVGAMYNGQYAKGFAHLLIFVLLVNLGDHNSGFGVLCFGWIVYMIFDAISTARARRDGLPLPNPLHLNDIGDRIAHSWSQSQRQSAAATGQPTNPAAANWQPVPPAPAQANWAGYVPPTAFGAGTTAPYTAPPATPYQPVDPNAYTQAGYVAPSVSQPAVDPNNAWNTHQAVAGAQFPVAPTRRFPVAAIVLIGLGILFLIGNVFQDIHLSGDTTTAIILAAVAAWSFYRRFTLADRIRRTTGVDSNMFMVHMLRWPIILATVSIMFALNALHVLTLGQTFPLILIVGGLLVLADRIGYSNATAASMPWVNVPPPAGTEPMAPAPAATEPNSNETEGAR